MPLVESSLLFEIAWSFMVEVYVQHHMIFQQFAGACYAGLW